MAPLEPDLAALRWELVSRHRRPGREAVLDDRLVGEDHGGLGAEVVLRHQRVDNPDEPVHGPERAVLVAVEALLPQTVALAAAEQCVRALTPGLGPALLARPAVHRVRREQRSGRAPHQLVGLVVDVLTHPLEERVGQLGAPAQTPRDEQEAALAAEQ